MIYAEYNTHISGWGSDGDNHCGTLKEAVEKRRALIDERSIAEKKIIIFREIRFKIFGWYVELSREIKVR